MTPITRRDFLKASAAASALAGLGLPSDALAASDERWVKSVCRYCGTGCGLHVGVRNGKVFAVKGDRDNHNRGLLCLKGFLLPQIMTAISSGNSNVGGRTIAIGEQSVNVRSIGVITGEEPHCIFPMMLKPRRWYREMLRGFELSR